MLDNSFIVQRSRFIVREGVLSGADLRAALHAAIAALDAEGRAGVADPLRRLVA